MSLCRLDFHSLPGTGSDLWTIWSGSLVAGTFMEVLPYDFPLTLALSTSELSYPFIPAYTQPASSSHSVSIPNVCSIQWNADFQWDVNRCYKIKNLWAVCGNIMYYFHILEIHITEKFWLGDLEIKGEKFVYTGFPTYFINMGTFGHVTSTDMGSHSLLQGIFPTQESNPSLLHCRQIFYHLSH